eukprot:COSAG01_NODE_255_length_20171_cov_8.232164_4_plen_94_part_00
MLHSLPPVSDSHSAGFLGPYYCVTGREPASSHPEFMRDVRNPNKFRGRDECAALLDSGGVGGDAAGAGGRRSSDRRVLVLYRPTSAARRGAAV